MRTGDHSPYVIANVAHGHDGISTGVTDVVRSGHADATGVAVWMISQSDVTVSRSNIGAFTGSATANMDVVADATEVFPDDALDDLGHLKNGANFHDMSFYP